MVAKRKIAWKEIAGLVLLAAIGGAVGAGAAIAGVDGLPALDLSPAETIIVAVALPLLYLLAIAAHELGHLLGARVVDFRTLLYIAGPLRIEWRTAGRQVGWNRSLLLAGGLVACAPRGNHELRRRTIVMVAAGPLLSLLLGAQCLAVWQATVRMHGHAGAPFAAQLVGVALLALGLASLLLGVITLFPTRSAGFYSDGARILRLLRGGIEIDREVALMSITGLAMGGTRPREWDPELVQRCAQIADGGPFEVAGRYYAFLHAVDCGDPSSARAHADFVVAHIRQMPKGGRASLLLGIATFLALHDGDAARARALLPDTRHALVPTPHQRALAEAAIRLADGDLHAAREHARGAIRLAAAALDSGAAQLDVSLAERILERAAAH